MSQWPYSVLGVSPDAEPAEIRRAYARKLKVTHPEDDPAGFQALREAYEAATGRGRRAIYIPETGFEETEEAGWIEPDTQPQPSRSTTAVPSTSPADGLVELRQALLDLIHEGAADEAKQTAFADIIASPALENVNIHNEVESWAAELIAHFPGGADSLIDPAIATFGWDRLERRWDTPHDVQWVLHRRNALIQLRFLRDPKGKMHRGYKRLQTAPKNGFDAFVHGGTVRPVLSLIETEPGLYPEFDSGVIEAWTEHLDNQPIKLPAFTRANISHLLRLLFVIFWFGFILFKCVSPEPPSAPIIRSSKVEDCRQEARAKTLSPGAWTVCAVAQKEALESLDWQREMSLVNLRKGEFNASEAGWAAVLAISPTDARALYGRGMARRALQYPDRGLTFINQALAIESGVGREFAGYGFPPPPDARPSTFPLLPKRENVPLPHGASITRPDIIRNTNTAQLEYPLVALRAEVEGRVIFNCEVRLDGKLTDCIIFSETPQDYGFAEAALAYARSISARPLLVDGKPMAGGQVTVPISFKLQ